MQLDQGYKGFSFSKEGPLDMRMDPDAKLTAHEIVNYYPEKELGTIFREYGEERHWRKVARTIVESRRKKPIKTTQDLVNVVLSAFGFKGRGKLHPATLIFQALRIAVNKELEAIEKGLKAALSFLSRGGRIGVISFHSLEDRIAKNVFRSVGFPRREKGPMPLLKLLTKKPLIPKFAETKTNPRARSAKMRFAEKL
jgi:16S rRNA (cytosine1402-N4)-methyltransferase